MVMNERKEVRKSRVSQEEITMRKSDIDSKHSTKINTNRCKQKKEKNEGSWIDVFHRRREKIGSIYEDRTSSKQLDNEL